MSLKITKNEFILAVVLAVAGLVFSSRGWLLYLNGLTPIEGLGVYYLLLFIYFMALSHFGLAIFHISINEPLQVIGLLMITFAVFIGVNFESAYVQQVTEGHMDGASNIYVQSEDGAAFYFWNTIQGYDIPTSRLLTFGVTPFIFALLGGLFASGKVEL